MKLAYLSASVLPSRQANSVHVMKMCSAFAALGHDVTLVAPATRDVEQGVDDLFGYYGVEPSFRVQKLAWLPVPARQHLYAYLAGRFVQREGFDLAFGRYPPACYQAAKRGLPIIYETHAPTSHYGKIGERLHRGILGSPGFRHMVVISQALKDIYVATENTAAEQILVAHDAADPVPGAEPRGLPTGRRPRIGYVGHLYAGRGVELIAGLAERCGWADFHCVGGKTEDVTLWRKRSADLENLTFHGFVAPAEAADRRLEFDVLIAPYQARVTIDGAGDTSGWMSPLKLFEYMATGRAVVCSDIPVLHEVLVEGETVLFCPPSNVEAWARSLERLRDEAGLAERLATNGLATFEREYTWRERARKILAGPAGA